MDFCDFLERQLQGDPQPADARAGQADRRDQGDGDRLFLQQTLQSSFADDDEYGDHALEVQNVTTRPSGLIHFLFGPPGQTTESEGTMQAADMEPLWEPMPTWGDWSGYARVDREQPNPVPMPFRL